MPHDPALLHVLGLLLTAAVIVAGVLLWDNKRVESQERRYKDRFRNKK